MTCVVHLDEEFHTALKAHCRANKLRMGDFVRDCCAPSIGFKVPMKEPQAPRTPRIENLRNPWNDEPFWENR